MFSPGSRAVFRETMNAELDRLDVGMRFVSGEDTKLLTQKSRAKSPSPLPDPAVSAEFLTETTTENFKHVAIPPMETPTKVRSRGGSFGYGVSRGESSAAPAFMSRGGYGYWSRGGAGASLPGSVPGSGPGSVPGSVPGRGGRPKGKGRGT